ncbi:hypothetical protein Efla_005766 [Eimeria flavescens]
MFLKLFSVALGFQFQTLSADEGWCRASPQAGLPDYARCLPADQAVARYVVEVAPVVAFGLELKSEVKIIVEGSNGRRTKAISVASAVGGTSKRVTVDRVDVSDPEVVHAYLTSPTAWACRQLTIWKDFRYWIFDCGEALSPLTPWFCKHITVRSGGTTATFKVSRWIGSPHSPSAYIPKYPSGVELAARDIDCHTRAADVFEGLPSGRDVLKVHCPMNCQASEFAHTQGSSLHPASSSICTSAILDGVLTPSGGDILMTAAGPVDQYTGAAFNGKFLTGESNSNAVNNTASGIESADFASSSERQQYSYHLYLVDSIDFITTRVRIVDEFGQLSSVGRLEVNVGGDWGTVCNKGDFLSFSFEAAIKACQELGFKTGVPLLDGCKDVEGANLCGEKGYNVATAATCLEHNDDVVLKCTNNIAGVEPAAGTIRLVGPTGTPAQSGIGRLQMYSNGFGSVCADGWSLSSEQVACRQMGYSSVKSKGPGNGSCSKIFGQNYCGQEQERIVASHFSCTDGDPSGVGAFRKEEAAAQKSRSLLSWHLSCFDTVESKGGLKGPPGTIYHVDESQTLQICRAALHSGTTTRDGGECILVAAHAQVHYSALDNHGIQSEESGLYPTAFTVARVDRSVHTYVASSHGVAPGHWTGPSSALPVTQPQTNAAANAHLQPGVAIAPHALQGSALTASNAGGSTPSAEAAQAASSAAGHPNPAISKGVATRAANAGMLLSKNDVKLKKQRGRQLVSSVKPLSIAALPSMGSNVAFGAEETQKRRASRIVQIPVAAAGQETRVSASPKGERVRKCCLTCLLPVNDATPAATYSRMIQLRSSLAAEPEDIFHWFPSEGHKGFRGKPEDFVDVSSLAEGGIVSSIRDFTLAVRAAVTGGEGKWRTLVAHSDCGGFALIVDRNNEVIFEQTCHPHQIKSGFKPKVGEVFDTAVSFSTASRLIQLFVNGQAVASEKADFDISLRVRKDTLMLNDAEMGARPQGHMVIGRASAAEADYFEGDILGVKLYNQEVSAATIRNAFSPESLAAHIPQAPSESRRTDDGRLCLSACTFQIPVGAGAPIRPTKPAVALSCVDSLSRPEFNNYAGQKVLAACPPDCLHANAPLEGCKIYTSRSSICKAGLHAGAIPKEGGELVVTLAVGLSSHEASHGHYGSLSGACETATGLSVNVIFSGIRSSQSTKPELRSFSVEAAPPFRSLPCDAGGVFTLKLGVGERELVICPAGCAAVVTASVYGSARCQASAEPPYMQELYIFFDRTMLGEKLKSSQQMPDSASLEVRAGESSQIPAAPTLSSQPWGGPPQKAPQLPEPPANCFNDLTAQRAKSKGVTPPRSSGVVKPLSTRPNNWLETSTKNEAFTL